MSATFTWYHEENEPYRIKCTASSYSRKSLGRGSGWEDSEAPAPNARLLIPGTVTYDHYAPGQYVANGKWPIEVNGHVVVEDGGWVMQYVSSQVEPGQREAYLNCRIDDEHYHFYPLHAEATLNHYRDNHQVMVLDSKGWYPSQPLGGSHRDHELAVLAAIEALLQPLIRQYLVDYLSTIPNLSLIHI